jgi:hypothetical protein
LILWHLCGSGCLRLGGQVRGSCGPVERGSPGGIVLDWVDLHPTTPSVYQQPFWINYTIFHIPVWIGCSKDALQLFNATLELFDIHPIVRMVGLSHPLLQNEKLLQHSTSALCRGSYDGKE